MNQSSPLTEQSDSLASQANAWVVRLTSGEATVEDARALKDWCAQSPQHAAAYQDAARLWKLAGQLPAASRARRPLRRLLVGGLAAACLALGVSAAIRVGVLPSGLALLADHHTGLGEHQQITLEDGSTVELDAKTRISVDFTPGQRRVSLGDGAAVFHVRHDPARPFVVSAQGGSVTAVGTVFEVRYRNDDIQVTCTQGAVQVQPVQAAPVLVRAGEQLAYGRRGASAVAPVDGEQALAWRQNLLVFKFRPLQDLVDELNRYRQGHILIADTRVAAAPVSGVFHLQRPDEVLQHIESSLQLSATRLPGGIIVLR
ncbi:transmembrane sensor [Pseudomonas nitritireducens]|uniref:Transmembrane sensor n=1 Tax=Pseudomonas nitroreducens TaxID=46680 RepID=A0A7W7KMU1_PSENT|nr:FecR family protein [Pseudomonas nitritireducens]MBB4865720.1 transmembrane sensor [Pseudomonas nitritireducens]